MIYFNLYKVKISILTEIKFISSIFVEMPKLHVDFIVA